tara:strand:+ start:26984 stop:41341 length:14358 start_codon:yes stop_codon:yes gene_type:complete
MPKFDSPIKVTSIQSASGNNTLLHLGADNRVGIGTDKPLAKLHVNGAVYATGLIVPASALAGQGDAAEFLGFTPNMDDWYVDTNGKPVVNGYVQSSEFDGTVGQSSDALMGEFSAEFNDDDVVWSREVVFDTPLYHDIFITGTMSYKFDSHTTGTPGIAVTLTHRETADSEFDNRDDNNNIIWNSQSSNTYIVPVSEDSKSGDALGKFTTPVWRAVTPSNREITRLKIEIISTNDVLYNTSDDNVHNDGGSGELTTLGGGTNFNWILDGFSLQFNHPDLRVDQLGRITGSFLADATVDDLKIGNFISSSGSKIHDNTAGFGTSVPEDNPHRPEDGISTGEEIQGLVSNGTFANGWSLSKTGRIRATDIEIYGPDGTIFIDGSGGGENNPFSKWANRSLRDLDSTSFDYLYGLDFSESNRANVAMRVGYRGYTGDNSGIALEDSSLYIANTSEPLTGSGNQLSNGTITFNGLSSNAPPGTIFTGEKTVVRNLQGAYILFLANTDKWSTTTGTYSEYHANNYLGDYGLYVVGMPTVGGWLYHPHANDTWYSIDSMQSGEYLHERDFLTIGRAGTDGDGHFIESLTSINSPTSLDAITADESRGSYPPIGITAGGVLFADIHINQYNHTANNGEIQLTNPRNSPNTQFTFIHPGTNDPNDSTLYTANGARGVLMSLEDFPGSRYITFIGADPSRFTFYDDGHSPDFVAAYPIGNRWFYNQDEGRSSLFVPDQRDCIVARVDSNGVSMTGDGSSGLTNIYRYAEREATTAEGVVLSDMIIDPPRGMSSGGIVFADFTINEEFNDSTEIFTANDGFVTFTNPLNTPRNEFYVVHPENPLYFWQTSNVERGVATSLTPTVNATGTRHIAFVGHNSARFPAIAAYENVSNDFIAVSKYNYQGNPRSDGKWYYDPGSGISDDYVFDVDANDFIVATLSSFNPNSDGIDQITRYAENEGVIFVEGEPLTVSSIRNLLNDRIDAANTVAAVAIEDAERAFVAATAAGDSSAQALGLLDGAITVYLQSEGDLHVGESDSEFANNKTSGPPSHFDYNDLWINTSTYNRAIDGSWYSNAIFRFSNTLGGFNGTLRWTHDRTNPQGLSFLQGLTARGFADRAATFFYMDKIGTDPYYGPNVATIKASGPDQDQGFALLNFNPEGDMWFDTTPDSANTNQPFIYRTNTSFSTSNATNSGYANGIGHAGAWAQTAFDYFAGNFDPTTNATGWYNNRDSAFATATDATARQAAADAESSAAAALAAAVDAQDAADNEILAYFQINTDVPEASGNGDVWIHTDNLIKPDGTLNAAAIFVANTKSGGIPDPGAVADATSAEAHWWYASPNNAIGLMYAKSYFSGVSGAFDRGTNLMPRGYSLFDSPLSDYVTRTTNIDDTIPEPFAFHATQTAANVAVDRTGGANSYIGDSSLRIDTTYVYSIIYFGKNRITADFEENSANNLPFMINIPKGRKFIFSYYLKSDASTSITPSMISSNSVNAYAGTVQAPPFTTTPGDWKRYEHVFDFTTGDMAASSPKNQITSVMPGFLYGSRANTFIDAIQLEEVPNTVFTASQFKEPSDAKSIVFGREITDGKIVTHYSNNFYSGGTWYGPIPNTTPTGYPNPEPNGDFWVNTGNNNIVFRYHQNDLSFIPSSQTVYWTSETNGDGWYTTEDLRTGNALSTSFDALANAATAQAAADHEILAYFEPDAPDASGFGDIWIDVDKYATLNSSAIHVANTQSSGGIGAGSDLFWHIAPNNAIGQVYLDVFLSEKKAGRSESLLLSVMESDDLPFPVSPNPNGISVGATGNVVFYKNSNQEYLEDQTGTDKEGTIFISNRGGIDFVGPKGNIYYPESGDYGVPETGTVLTSFRISGSSPESTTVSNSTFSSLYLMYSNMSAVTRFGTTASAFGTHKHIIPVQWNNTTWQAVEADDTTHDFTPDSANGDFLVAQLSREYAFPEGFGELDSWIFKTLPAQTRAIGDGKIVTHFGVEYESGAYGPRANLTPSGIYNPEPHGDFWINTSNNNLIFRYHQNVDNNWAQTAFHAPTKPEDAGDQSGWYSTEDVRIANNEQQATNTYSWLANTSNWAGYLDGETVNNSFWTTLALANAINANTAAYIAQASADREINAFFSVHDAAIPLPTGNGDVWIHTDNAITNDPNPATRSTKNTGAIFVSNASAYAADYKIYPASHVGELWDFSTTAVFPNDSGVYHNWGAHTDTHSFVNNNALKLERVGSPNLLYLYKGGNLPTHTGMVVNGSTHTHVRVRMRAMNISSDLARTWLGTLYFENSDSASVGYGGTIASTIPEPNWTLGEWTELVFDMSSEPRWTGSADVERLQIRFSYLNPLPDSDIFEIDWIRIDDGTPQFYWGWHQSPENAVGGMYIDSYAAGITYTDGRVVTQYSDHFGTTPPDYYGPLSNVTPTGSDNPYPDGDLWVDTSNNNIMFRYNQNTTINYAQTAYWEATTYTFDPVSHKSGWYALEDPRLANNEVNVSLLEIHLANTDAWAANLEGNTVNNSYWSNFALGSALYANGVAYNANAAAYLAQASADHEILAYFQIHSDAPEATGNGDVWIHTDTLIKPTDGTLNTGAIFVSNTKLGGIPDDAAVGAHFWYSSPNNAIGLMYAKSYSSGVGGEFDRSTNIMPRAWSLFDAPRELYSNTAPLVDTVPYPYHTPNAPSREVNFDIVDDQNPPVGEKALYLTPASPDLNSGYIYLATNSTFQTSASRQKSIEIPFGKKWMLSWYAKNAEGASDNDMDSGVHVYAANNSHPDFFGRLNRGIAQGGTQNFVGADWERHWFGFDLSGNSIIEGVVNATSTGQGNFWDAGFKVDDGPGTSLFSSANSANRIALRIDPGGVNTIPIARTLTYYAGFQLEDVTASGRVVPSEFQEPSDTSALIFDREITDGKIVTQFYASKPQSIGYGPQANVTPSGLPNPEPHGDFLIDTSNNNIMFRYHQNIPSARVWSPDSTFAQTLIYTSPAPGDDDGWYALEDPRLANTESWLGTTETTLASVSDTASDALQKAASAASAADAEIQVFFEPSTNTIMYDDGINFAGVHAGPATGNGDIWIHIDQVYDADGNQNTGSIFFANLSPDFPSVTTYSWQASPDNAIGRAFLDQFTSTGRKNWIPSGYSTWDADVDTTGFVSTPNYNITGSAAGEPNGESPYPVTINNNYTANAYVNTSFGKVSDGSLQVTDFISSPVDWQSVIFTLANTAAPWRRDKLNSPKGTTVKFPKGKRWIFSYYAYSNSSLDINYPFVDPNLYVYDSANTTANTGVIRLNAAYPESGKWNRYSAVLDFSNTHPGATIDEYTLTSGVRSAGDYTGQSQGVDISGPPYISTAIKDIDSIHLYVGQGGIGNTVWYDGFQLEEAPGAQVIAGPFSDPDRFIDINFARSIADGKIVSHYVDGTNGGPTGRYGPRPHRTPQGQLNLAPHGDQWIDTGNNNMTYRYNANTSYEFETRDRDDLPVQVAYWDTVSNRQNQSGWYIVRDQLFESNIVDAFQNLSSQFTQITNLEATTDGELQIFFEEEGGDFVNAIGTYPDSKYGDLWINVSGYNKFANGTLDSNAIFRWQNTSQGYLPENGLAWHHAPNNSIGKVYLRTYAAQNAADSSVTAYFMDGFGAGTSQYHGPQTNTTPSGLDNPNPDGDMWIDTQNNNVVFVYNRVGGPTVAEGFAQTIYYAGDDGFKTAEGWHSSEDLRTVSADLALEIAKATGTDRFAEIFYSGSAPATSTGNGDIWIDTSYPLKRDGSANTLSIYIANTYTDGVTYGDAGTPRLWHLDETSALGRSSLDGYNADQKSARAELIELVKNRTPRSDGYSFPFPIYPEPNGIMGVGATGNVKFYSPSDDRDGTFNPGEIDVINNGGIPFIGPDGIERTLTGLSQPNHIIYGGNFGEIYTRFEGSIAGSQYTTEANTAYLMYTATTATSRFGGGGGYGQIGNIIAVVWDNDTESWYTYSNEGVTEFPFIPDADQGDFLVAELRRPLGDAFPTVQSWVLDSVNLPQQLKSYSDGKTVYFTGPAYDEGNFKNVYGPDPSITSSGVINLEPHGDKFISSNAPYKTYLYFSNSTNKTSQTIFHSYYTNSATFLVANTNYPYGTSNTSSGWYEYRDTGDALTQEGFQVSLGRISLGQTSYSDNDPLTILDRGIGLPEDADNENPAPILDVGGTSTFGQTREILLNPVPPSDQNLQGHWTLNSYDVDDDGHYLVRDISGRNNHATFFVSHNPEDQPSYNQAPRSDDFQDQDPAADVINVSGNRSMFMQASRSPSMHRPWTALILASNGSVSNSVYGTRASPPMGSIPTHTYQGSNYPVDITDATKFNKSTLCFWWKPSPHIHDGYVSPASIGQDKYIVGQNHNHNGGWSLRVDSGIKSGSVSEGTATYYEEITPTANGDVPIIWYNRHVNENLLHKPSAEIYLDGWYGANDGGTYTPIRANEWHFITIQSNYDDNNQTLWIYREGEGLLYHNVSLFHGNPATDASTVNRALVLNGLSNETYGTYGNANGNYDEVRLYNSILTPRNIRYLYENPTGRPHQLQPRPGLAVKKGYDKFDNGYPNAASDLGDGGIGINAYAYFHGYDVDGNPADVNPYVSQDGRVTYLNRGHVLARFSGAAERVKYSGNTFYIFYNTNPSPSDFGTDYYTICQPVGNDDIRFAENTGEFTWRGLTSTDANWKYFTPNEAVQFVIGEGRFDQEENQPYSHASQMKDLKIYQFSRSFETIRESYNFNISREDFIGDNFGDHFFANVDFWTGNSGQGLINGTYIANLSVKNSAIDNLAANKIQAGTIGVGLHIGGDNKILLDGTNNRIIISD